MENNTTRKRKTKGKKKNPFPLQQNDFLFFFYPIRSWWSKLPRRVNVSHMISSSILRQYWKQYGVLSPCFSHSKIIWQSGLPFFLLLLFCFLCTIHSHEKSILNFKLGSCFTVEPQFSNLLKNSILKKKKIKKKK